MPVRLPESLRRPLWVSGALFGLMLAIRAWLQWIGPLPGDRYAVTHYSAAAPGLPHWLISAYVAIADPGVVALTLLAGVWALLRYIGFRAAAGLVLCELVIVWNAGLKLLFGATPLWAETHHPGVNFPSGHASYVMAVFGYLAWIGFRQRRPDIVAVCALIIVGMGFERVLSGVHLVSDVAGGCLLGLAWLILVVSWVRAAEACRGEPRRRRRTALAVPRSEPEDRWLRPGRPRSRAVPQPAAATGDE